MTTYQLRRLQIFVRGEWIEVPIDRLTAFTLRLSGAGRTQLGGKHSSGYTGGWTISGIPVPTLDLAGVELVEVETTEGDCWRGPGTLQPDGPRLTLIVAGELHLC